MKLMKAIHMIQNTINKTFQHFVEFQLIQVRKMKIRMIQFFLSLNLIQMELTKVISMMKNKMNREALATHESHCYP
jgi:hypothetical protein